MTSTISPNIVPTRTPHLTRYAWLSIAAAVLTIGLKLTAYFTTGAMGLLSDAAESVVNLIAAVFALAALRVAAQPPDHDHAYGHDKVEYFSSGIEGIMILVAAIGIAVGSVNRLLHPQALEQLSLGLIISTGASVVNLVVARILLRVGKRYDSITLEADGHHLMTDVWTSVGILVGLVIISFTGWGWLDPVIALLVALNITFTAVNLMRRSALGLLDTMLPTEELAAVRQVLSQFECQDISFHALRTRQSGSRRFVSMHVLVPDTWTIKQGHALLEQVEAELRKVLPRVTVFTHLEPINDPTSFADEHLDRSDVLPSP